MEVAYFLESGARFKPNYVMLNYFINDAEPTPRYGSSFLARHSRAYVYLASRVDAALRQVKLADHADWKSYYAGLYNEEGVHRVESAIERLAQRCRAQGIRLFVANYPELRAPRD